jgi:hypothetical protein
MYPNAIRCSFQQSTVTIWPTHETVCLNVPLIETNEYSAGPLWLAYQLYPCAPVYNPMVATTHNTHYARCAVRTLISLTANDTYAKRL